jgi:hypothetical protein
MTAPENALAGAFLGLAKATAEDAKKHRDLKDGKIEPHFAGALLARVMAMGGVQLKARETPLRYALRMRREGRWEEYIRKPNISKRRRRRAETGDKT